MGHTLIIAEKPRAAERIASALAEGPVSKVGGKGVTAYRLERGGESIVVAPAVGHVYTLKQDGAGGWVYPVFDVSWAPTHEVRKDGGHTQRYLAVLKQQAKGAACLVVACDYDVEGSVIGYNVVRFACNAKDARRMKFSTLTKHELVEAFEGSAPSLDWGMVEAGLTRHVADWYYGINLSRALTLSIKNAVGMYKVMSTGRVQGPTLAILAEREREIRAFSPTPFWLLELHVLAGGQEVVAQHVEDKFWELGRAEACRERARADRATVAAVERKRFEQAVPPPFDLTSLQTEAYKQFGFPPSMTQELAQVLYESGLISYPRTSSQKLPAKLGFPDILNGLSSMYPDEVSAVLSLPALVPKEGAKEDPAHPSIYPTGERPRMLTERERKLYDLVARRFLAVFGRPAVRESLRVTLRSGEELFEASGTRTVEPNWHRLYGPYARFEEVSLPDLSEGQEVGVRDLLLLDRQTQPPKRYTAASLVKRMEKEDIGTKATRADIIDTLVSRGYVRGDLIEVTDLGLQVCEVLAKYSPRILDVELTRQFEKEMERIQSRAEHGECQAAGRAALGHMRAKLEEILSEFKENEPRIGQELADAIKETNRKARVIAACPACREGELRIVRSKKSGKRFAGCSKYPKCSNSYPLPQMGTISSSRAPCPACGSPVVTVRGAGRRPWRMCLNMGCSSRKGNGGEAPPDAGGGPGDGGPADEGGAAE